MKFLLAPLIIVLLGAYTESPLATYKTDKAQSSLKIEGTSTMHDWEITAEDLMGTINVDRYSDHIVINNLSLTVPVKSLKSDNSGMDKNTYKTLKAEDHPKIHYQFTSLQDLEKTTGNQMKLVTKGKLTVGGTTRVLTIPILATLTDNGIELKGKTSFKMTSFNLEPPSFMFGSVTTGDEITVHFNIKFN